MATELAELTDQIADLIRQVASLEDKVMHLFAQSNGNGSKVGFAELYGKYPGPPWSEDEDFEISALKFKDHDH